MVTQSILERRDELQIGTSAGITGGPTGLEGSNPLVWRSPIGAAGHKVVMWRRCRALLMVEDNQSGEIACYFN